MSLHTYKRIFLIVMDSVGIGEAPDADKYNDKGTTSTAEMIRRYGFLKYIPSSENMIEAVIKGQKINSIPLSPYLLFLCLLILFKLFTEVGPISNRNKTSNTG